MLESSRVITSPEPFTPDERAALAPYFTNLDSHVFALTNLPETVKGALFARYSRSAKSLRRLFLDEFAGNLAGDPGRTPSTGRRRARREALRAGLQRVRRRLGRAARRRAHRLRGRVEHPDEGARVGPPDGLPRAVDAVRALHRQARTAAGAITCRPKLGRARCASATSTTMDAAFETYARWIDGDAGRTSRARYPQSAAGLRRRAPRGDPRQGARHAARHAAGGDAVERRHLRHRPGLRGAAAPHARAPARRSPALRATRCWPSCARSSPRS